MLFDIFNLQKASKQPKRDCIFSIEFFLKKIKLFIGNELPTNKLIQNGIIQLIVYFGQCYSVS